MEQTYRTLGNIYQSLGIGDYNASVMNEIRAEGIEGILSRYRTKFNKDLNNPILRFRYGKNFMYRVYNKQVVELRTIYAAYLEQTNQIA
jgi:hypothetical protein